MEPLHRCSRRPWSQAVLPRRLVGVRDGASTQPKDVLELILAKWDAVSPGTFSHFWENECILPLRKVARLIAEVVEYRTSIFSIAVDPGEIVNMIGTCAVSQEIIGEGSSTEKQLVVEEWLGLDEDMHAIERTVDYECSTERASGRD